MNFNQLVIEVQRITGRNDSGFTDRIKKSINRALRQWARALPWDGLKKHGTIAHSGGRDLYLPAEVERLIWLLDKTNQEPVVTSSQWDRDNAYELAQDQNGYASQWEFGGVAPTWTPVSGPISIYNSGASDVLSVYVTGLAQHTSMSGPMGLFSVGETLSLIGLTAATGTNSFYRIDSICKSDDSDGYITIQANGTDPVAILSPFERESQYRKVRLLDIPAAATEFMYCAYVRPTPLVNGAQTTDPSVDKDFLIWAAASDIFWQLREGDRAKGAWKKAEEIARHERGVERGFGDWSGRVVPEDLR